MALDPAANYPGDSHLNARGSLRRTGSTSETRRSSSSIRRSTSSSRVPAITPNDGIHKSLANARLIRTPSPKPTLTQTISSSSISSTSSVSSSYTLPSSPPAIYEAEENFYYARPSTALDTLMATTISNSLTATTNTTSFSHSSPTLIPTSTTIAAAPVSMTEPTAVVPTGLDSHSGALILQPSPPVPIGTYIAASQFAISAALKVAVLSTKFGLGIARLVVTNLDHYISRGVNLTTTGRATPGIDPNGSVTPGTFASLPFRAALLGINFSDVLVQTILETVDGTLNLALNTLQDGIEMVDTLYGGQGDGGGQAGETFREVWMILNREWARSSTSTSRVENLQLLMAYIAVQYATSERWETERVQQLAHRVAVCVHDEHTDENTPNGSAGSSHAWSAIAPWPHAYSASEQSRLLEIQDIDNEVADHNPGDHDNGVNPELTAILADSYRFSRFCSAMYGQELLEIMGSKEEHYPPAPDAPSCSGEANAPPINNPASHFHRYTGTPLGSILHSSDEAATNEGFYTPRYYILKDSVSRQIVLVMRGTKSLHDLMIDLTCDTTDLVLPHDTTFEATEESGSPKIYKVHGGFLRAARTIASAGTIGIFEKVQEALMQNADYNLLLIGHSLGAGIASILAMLWADPHTGASPVPPSLSPSGSFPGQQGRPFGSSYPQSAFSAFQARSWDSGLGNGHQERDSAANYLPSGRRVRCLAYGSPQVMCPRMSRHARKLVTSITYGDDVVARLSLGTVRNISHGMSAIQRIQPSYTATATNSQDMANKKSIGLEIVQKMLRWKITKEESILQELMTIRHQMHHEMDLFRDFGDSVNDNHQQRQPSSPAERLSVLVPAGKVLWIRPSWHELEMQKQEEKNHPVEALRHQFDWEQESRAAHRHHFNQESQPSSQRQEQQQQQQTRQGEVMYRMYALPEPELILNEILFSTRMWTDHMPLNYEYILAGKHAVVSATSPSPSPSSPRLG